jgi:hypothetical protein
MAQEVVVNRQQLGHAGSGERDFPRTGKEKTRAVGRTFPQSSLIKSRLGTGGGLRGAKEEGTLLNCLPDECRGQVRYRTLPDSQLRHIRRVDLAPGRQRETDRPTPARG